VFCFYSYNAVSYLPAKFSKHSKPLDYSGYVPFFPTIIRALFERPISSIELLLFLGLRFVAISLPYYDTLITYIAFMTVAQIALVVLSIAFVIIWVTLVRRIYSNTFSRGFSKPHNVPLWKLIKPLQPSTTLEMIFFKIKADQLIVKILRYAGMLQVRHFDTRHPIYRGDNETMAEPDPIVLHPQRS
jgi:hypothetical protein